MASLGVHLACLRIKWEVFKHEMLPGYHIFGQPLGDDIENIWLGVLSQCRQIPDGKQRLVIPRTWRNLEQLVQAEE